MSRVQQRNKQGAKVGTRVRATHQVGMALLLTSLLSSASLGNDREIGQAISARLRAEQQSQNLQGFQVNLKVDDGVASMRGSVADEQQLARVLDITRRVPGVRLVVNELRVENSPAKPKGPAFAEGLRQPPSAMSTVSNPFAGGSYDSGNVRVASNSSPLGDPTAAHQPVAGLLPDGTLAPPQFTGPGPAQGTMLTGPVGNGVPWGNMATNPYAQAGGGIPRVSLPGAAPMGHYGQGGPMPGQRAMAGRQPMARNPMQRQQGYSQPAAGPRPIRVASAMQTNYTPGPMGPGGGMAQGAGCYQDGSGGGFDGSYGAGDDGGGSYDGGGYSSGGPMPQGMPGSGGGISGAMSDNPSLPPYAWPSYASHPNYAALTYPTQYSPTAWPYIGPFYPYPQVPLGWRKVMLEWDDGWWFLDFKAK